MIWMCCQGWEPLSKLYIVPAVFAKDLPKQAVVERNEAWYCCGKSLNKRIKDFFEIPLLGKIYIRSLKGSERQGEL